MHNDYLVEALKYSGIAVAGVLLFIGILTAVIGNAILYNQASNYERITGKRTEVVWFDAMYVEHEGRMMRYDEYKAYITAGQIKGKL